MIEKPVLEQFVSVRTAAESLGCTPDFIYQMISSGELRAIKMGTRAIRVSAASLKALVEANWINPGAYQCDKAPEIQQPEQKRSSEKPVARSNWMSQK